MESAESILQEKAEPGSQPPWWRVIVTPWADIFRPRTAAAHMVAASPWAFWITFSLHALLLTAVVLWLALWDASVERHVTYAQTPLWLQLLFGAPNWTREVYERSYAEVWRDWRQRGSLSPATLISFFVPLFIVVCTSFGAWLHLITVHTAGPVWRSYARSWRAIGGCFGLLLLFTFGLGSGVVIANNRIESGLNESSVMTILVPSFPACACFALAWIGTAVGAVRSPSSEIRFQPRCEGCGYDLTHVPDNDRCPECGFEASSSLTPNVRRPGSPWENDRGIQSWFTTSTNALLRPREFYGKLQLRIGEDRLRPFTRWHFLSIGCVASIWIAIAATASWYVAPLGEELLAVSMMVGFLAAFIGWVVHRTVGAVASSWWLARGLLADFTWARKVLAYETVFLWAFCLFNGLLVSSFFAFGIWISSSAASPVISNVFQMPAELAAVVFGNLALGLLWLWRHRIAVRAIRWSNF